MLALRKKKSTSVIIVLTVFTTRSRNISKKALLPFLLLLNSTESKSTVQQKSSRWTERWYFADFKSKYDKNKRKEKQILVFWMTCGHHRGRIILFMVVWEILKAVLGVSCTSVRLIGEGIQKDVRGGFGGIQRLLPLSFHSLFSLLFFFSPSVFIPEVYLSL